jgi:hypothetical protein
MTEPVPLLTVGDLKSELSRWSDFTPKSFSIADRSFSTSAGAPIPLRSMLAPALAKARAHARPMPLVEPVTSAVLPFRIPMLFTVFWLRVTIR